MALIYMDGFDHYGVDETLMTSGLYAQQYNTTLNAVQVRTGASSLKIEQNGGLRFAFPGGNKTVVGSGYVAWFDSLPAIEDTAHLFDFRDSSNVTQVVINMKTTGAIEAWRSQITTGGVLLGSSLPVITTGAWQHIEARVKIDNAVGEVEVRVNGVTVLSVSGVDTCATAIVSCAQIMYWTPNSAPSFAFYMDDLYIWDDTGSFNNTFLGDRRVITDVPNQDTATADWLKSSGVNGYAMIDELPPNDGTDYIYSATYVGPGDQSAFRYPNTPSNTSLISGVHVIALGIKTDAGPANTKSSMISGAFESLGAEKTLTQVWTSRFDLFETNPATGAPWTKAALDAASIAIRRTA
jgi:hypothetical protein